jgi:hypothetical protein
MTILEVLPIIEATPKKPMNTKIALTGLFAAALLMNVGCSTTKSASNKSTKGATVADNNQALPPVAEGPARPAWGSNISPYY